MGLEQDNTEKFAKVALRLTESPVVEDLSMFTCDEIFGTLGQSGVVGTQNGKIDFSLRSPIHIPKSNGSFGGLQRVSLFEGSLLADNDTNRTLVCETEKLIFDLKSTKSLKVISELHGGAFGIGVESEMVVYDNNMQIDSSVESCELTRGQFEEPHAPVSDPFAYLKMKSEYMLEKMSKELCIETSAPTTGTAFDLRLNDGREDIGPYIRVINSFLLGLLNEKYDPEAWSVWDQVARHEGLTSMRELLDKNGTLAPWFHNALHISIGMKHSSGLIRPESMIYTSDLITSCLGASLGWMTASTPIMFDVQPTLDGQFMRDVRLKSRHLLSTSGPNTLPIRNNEELLNRIISNVVNGKSHTIARASHTSQGNDGSVYAVMHGQVRLRHEVKRDQVGQSQTGRVEATGMGATPNLVDQVSALAYLQVLHVLALEADIHQTPADIYATQLGFTSASDFDVLTANNHFNTRLNSNKVSTAITDAVRLCTYVSQNYSVLRESAQIAKAGLLRMCMGPANSFKEYLDKPSGCFADVVQIEFNRHKDSVQLTRDIFNFQKEMADKMLKLSRSNQKLLEYVV